jgi:hypothetical protein
MDKRWRNLVVILVVIVFVLSFLFIDFSQFWLGEEEIVDEKNKKVSLLWIESQEINYFDLKNSLEHFSISLDNKKLQNAYSNSYDSYTRDLTIIEMEQVSIMNKYSVFLDRTLVDICMDLNSGQEILNSCVPLMGEFGDLLSERNDLGIDINILVEDYLILQNEFDDIVLTCQDLLFEGGYA